MTAHGLTVEERINLHIVPGSNGCIEWIGAKSPKGYGHIKYEGTCRLTHRIAWEIENGPIPDDMHILHHCDNPSCVNVGHMFMGTNADNVADRTAKKRHHNQQKTHCKYGHPFSVENTYINNGSRYCRICRYNDSVVRNNAKSGV